MARISDQLVERLLERVVTLSEENAKLKAMGLQAQCDALKAERDWIADQYSQLHKEFARRSTGGG